MAPETTPIIPAIYDMQLHQVIKFYKEPYFRVMRVASGWLYNFWNAETGDYETAWVFVPFSATFHPTRKDEENLK
jgi:hypothetical protein